jgi:hypothetical protein
MIGIILFVLAAAVFPGGRAQGQGDDYLPHPSQGLPMPHIAMSLPTTGDPRTDLIALMTLSATLLTLAESVQKRRHGNLTAGADIPLNADAEARLTLTEGADNNIEIHDIFQLQSTTSPSQNTQEQLEGLMAEQPQTA